MQYIPFSKPYFGAKEKKEVAKALDSGWVTLGPRTKKFEEKVAAYVGSKYAIGVSSCTAALHLSLLVAGIKPGDEVITSVFTFAATINAILYTGAKPILVDIDPKTYNIDPFLVEKSVTKRTKAIIPVHYAGQPCDVDALKKIAKKHNLVVIEDAAHAIGSSYKGKKIGVVGDLTCFSFHPIKNISTGDGGMITTNNKIYADKLQLWRLHGMSKQAWKRHTEKGSWQYDILLPGYKYNMTDVAAALGIHQIDRLNSFIDKRKRISELYDKKLSSIPEITIPNVKDKIEHSRNLYTIRINTKPLTIDRDRIVNLLKERGIGTSVYFMPLHMFSYYKKILNYKQGSFPIAEAVFDEILSLPVFPAMTLESVRYVSKQLQTIIKHNRI